MTTPLSAAARMIGELRERLKADYGLEDGDEALETTLEGESNLPEMLASMARQAVEAEDYSAAIGNRIKILSDRVARLESRAQRIRVAMAWVMSEAGMNKIPADVLPDMTVSMRDGNAPLIIPDGVSVPDEYCRIKREPDRPLIRTYLQGGKQLPFAYLGNPMPTLTIRSK